MFILRRREAAPGSRPRPCSIICAVTSLMIARQTQQSYSWPNNGEQSLTGG
jgi:hypothetical protein